MEPAGAHILVVDDDDRLRELLRKYLSTNGYHVTGAINAAEARTRIASLSFDLIILDVMMPGESGIDLARSLRTKSEVPILLLTARTEVEDRIAGLQAGADDYLAKPFEPRELLLRVEAILRRARRPDLRTAVAMGPQVFDIARGELMRDGKIVKLTTAEAEMLRLFARNAGAVQSRAEIAKLGAGAERAVDVHITRLRRKIEPDPRNPRYLKTVWGEGYVLWPD